MFHHNVSFLATSPAVQAQNSRRPPHEAQFTGVGPIPFGPVKVGDSSSLVGAKPIDSYDDLLDIEYSLKVGWVLIRSGGQAVEEEVLVREGS